MWKCARNSKGLFLGSPGSEPIEMLTEAYMSLGQK